ncbi:RWD-domain-containing protein [Punctularia strigosozonata HHB-11173 SS5]|uniref:RWD-domain-containing protein n=1 Tax=Punctularia strigosozonata (strain HHB-11173) TaxID=741275 RepID=UPI0004417810|nr:RWD-domain-containing protein [Punctularia strigosozonata HHB-11173 SS5]EIN07418.1 RWD-domain-containing protein [Punctularia strigosozonata HHB-11173 SS5]
MSSEALLEEYEVLESIYPTELSKLSERDVAIEVEPEDAPETDEPLKLTLNVHYPDDYPDVLPDLTLDPIEGEVSEAECAQLVEDLLAVGQDNIGMAMTFTLVSHLREKLAVLVREREEARKKEEMEKERRALEAEEALTRGTPVTVDSFKAWKAKFDKEMAEKKAKEEDEKLKGMSPKEREEYKRVGTRLSGRQLFERNRDLVSADDSLADEGTSVDIRQYDRSRIEEEEEEERVTFSDSD